MPLLIVLPIDEIGESVFHIEGITTAGQVEKQFSAKSEFQSAFDWDCCGVKELSVELSKFYEKSIVRRECADNRLFCLRCRIIQIGKAATLIGFLKKRSSKGGKFEFINETNSEVECKKALWHKSWSKKNHGGRWKVFWLSKPIIKRLIKR